MMKILGKVVGVTFSHVMKVNVYLADINDFSAMNSIYETFFTEHYPARAVVQVANLPKAALVEIEAVAIVGDIITKYIEA